MIKKLSIIFPLYNEEKRLNQTFLEINKFKKKNKNMKLEILFVNDGSSDKSAFLINNFIMNNKMKNLKFKDLKLKSNMGKGYALKFGVKRATMPWILTLDIDLSVSLFQITKWESSKFLKKEKIFFGSRNLKNSIVKKSLHRFLLGKLFNFLVKIILDISLFDTQCGFKLYKRNEAKNIFSKLTNYGFTHDLEIVLLARKKKIKIKELPVKWLHKSGSKLNILYDSSKMFLNIFLLKIKYFN